MINDGLGQWLKDRRDYRQLKLLGTGASGEVHLCEEISTGRRVAVKSLMTCACFRDLRCFIREITCLIRLQAFGVPRLYGFCLPGDAEDASEPPLIIMEYLEHGTLRDVIDRKNRGAPVPGFGPTNTMKIIYGVAAIMAEIHKLNVLHRDLKSENVFLNAQFEPIVADFGLSRGSKPTDLTRTLGIGTPMFMPPEVLSDTDHPYRPPVDVWSYGVLVYDLFGLSIQFEDECRIKSPQQMVLRLMRGARFKKVPSIPDSLWNLIMDCWNAEPEKRPTFQEIVQRLAADETLVLPGTDVKMYREYQKRISGALQASREKESGVGNRETREGQQPRPLAGHSQCRPAKRFSFARKVVTP
jgi:serine/threonine protein kinase